MLPIRLLQFDRLVGATLICGLLYALLCWGIASDSPILIGFMPHVPAWAGVIAIAAIGPAAFLAIGVDAWPLFAAAIAAILICLACAWHLFRRRPDSEMFIALILVAMFLWACCGWSIVVMYWT